MLSQWIKARWAEISTKAGLVLTAVAAIWPQISPQLQIISPASSDKVAMIGAVLGIVMVVRRERGSAA